jgi:hypothetical protein
VARLISVASLRWWLARHSTIPVCSFCGRRGHPGSILGGAAGGRICIACVRVCAELVRDRAAADRAERWVWR